MAAPSEEKHKKIDVPPLIKIDVPPLIKIDVPPLIKTVLVV
jgi:hypothetical protein